MADFPLQRGSKGAKVIELQNNLNKKGAGLNPDGDFGGKTEAALLKYTGKKIIYNQQELNAVVISTTATATPSSATDNKTAFVLKYWTDAKANSLETQVPVTFTLAQAALESAWGKSAPEYNFFGIKAGKTWTGQTQKLKTWECGASGKPSVDGIKDELIQIYPPNTNPAGVCPNKFAYRVFGLFRAYATAKEGFKDHDVFLKINSRYAAAFKYTEPKEFATEVAKAGYATDPNYAKVLHTTIDTITKILQDNKLA